MPSLEQLLIVTGVLLLLAVLASKASNKLGIPALLLFLLIGMVAGSEGPGKIPFDNASLAQFAGVIALAFILFAGGLDSSWPSVSPVLWQGLSLASIGVFLTAFLAGSFAAYLFNLSWLQGLLLGSIVSSTDAAAVFSVLRSQRISLKGRMQPLLEFESGTNDPMAVFLTLGLVQVLTLPGHGLVLLVPLFAEQMGIGAVVGFAAGKSGVWLMNWIKLDVEGLYTAITVCIVLLGYGVTAALGGSGFLAVYLAGLVMGNSDFVHRRSLTRFHDGLSWLMQIALFLVLGLLVFPSRLIPLAAVSVLFTFFLIVVARPVSVFVALALAKLHFRQKLFVSWVGLRGAVPIVLATFPLLGGVPQADLYFNIVFFTVAISVLVQGTTIGWVAKRLNLEIPSSGTDRRFPPGVAEIWIGPESPAAGKQLVTLHIPRDAHIMLLARGSEHLLPRGSTILNVGDILSVVATPEALAKVRAILGTNSKS
ncbi:MAG TPA: potassium/proton antiporter [Bryobacteraceae bacterium]